MTSAEHDDGKIADYWSGRAAHYHHNQVTSLRAEANRAAWQEIITRFLPPPPARVLDVGCGSGYLSHQMAHLGYEVIGVDFSAKMLDQARRAGESSSSTASFMLGDAQLPPVHGPFDVVTSRFLLWTLPDPAGALATWEKLLVPGGRIVAFDANWFPAGAHADVSVDSDDGEDAFTRVYDRDQLAALPLATATSIQPYLNLFSAAGLEQVQGIELEEISVLDQKFGVSRGHTIVTQYGFVGIKQKQ
ncbi:class I SAM-dependent methyltransferase [Corynebacterium cystitidis]|uniref:class I SAM-dependent methyltransferase n=1 Tax=Corynebacterium cystitidis TaxID=35757 RepID=UPI00211F216F|nr:class I SAM-dependent methyltransferase [Corynebacterium cystitidis]